MRSVYWFYPFSLGWNKDGKAADGRWVPLLGKEGAQDAGDPGKGGPAGPSREHSSNALSAFVLSSLAVLASSQLNYWENKIKLKSASSILIHNKYLGTKGGRNPSRWQVDPYPWNGQLNYLLRWKACLPLCGQWSRRKHFVCTLSFYVSFSSICLDSHWNWKQNQLVPSVPTPHPKEISSAFWLILLLMKYRMPFSLIISYWMHSLSPPFSNKKNKTDHVIGQWFYHYW